MPLVLPSREGQPNQDEGTNPDGDAKNNQLANGVILQQIPGKKPTSWSVPKGAMTRFARGHGSLGSVGRSYVRAGGGATGRSSSARAGRQTAGKLGSFFATGIRDGFIQAARGIGLTNLIGRDVQFVLAAFVDFIAPSGATIEEAIARKALADTTWEVFQKYGVDIDGIAALDRLDREDVTIIISLYISNYINERLQEELFYRVEKGALDEITANHYADQIKGFIVEVVRLDFQDIDPLQIDWHGATGQDIIEKKYQEAYALLGEA
jgi:hypothetical protein